MTGDMRGIPYENEFDGVTNIFTAFGYFEEERENFKVIQDVSRALKKGGNFCWRPTIGNGFFGTYERRIGRKSTRNPLPSMRGSWIFHGVEFVKNPFYRRGEDKRAESFPSSLYPEGNDP
ncbi:class I SAM-dependent methyltransferase [candidate division TA06 bacterium]|nr:class I SAM-dependent methyltransferase [candidate division TA06 bacterium]